MSSSSSGAKRRWVHVVKCNEKPKDPEDFYIQTLTAVLGSEEAAKKAYISGLGYNDFAVANLTPEQVDQISKQPCVSLVYESNSNMRLCRRM